MVGRRWLRGKRTPRQAFSDEMAQLIPRLLPVQRVEPRDDFSLHITLRDGSPVVMFLDNIFAEASRLEGEARNDRLRRAVLAMAPPPRPASWEAAAPKVLPAVRAASSAAASTSSTAYPIRTLIVPFVVRLIAIDEEHSMSFATDKDVRSWGVETSEVEATALDNLRSSGATIGVSPDRSWLEVLGPDGYASSWLTAPDALDHIAEELGHDYVVVARSRDSLRLLSTRDPAMLRAELDRELADYQTEPRALTPVPYEVRDGSLTVWEPPVGHPCRRLTERAQHVLAATEYGYQQAVLKDLFEKAGEDVFVAKLGLMEGPEGSVWSFAAWVRGVTAALVPRADYLGLVDTEAAERFLVRWDEAVRVAGDALPEDSGYYPPRWRVGDWPVGAALAELRDLAADPQVDGR